MGLIKLLKLHSESEFSGVQSLDGERTYVGGKCDKCTRVGE